MPELPEVETVKRGLQEILTENLVVEKAKASSFSLREPIPSVAAKNLKGQKIQAVDRRAKYLLFHTDKGVLINHLGMTGTWRLTENAKLELHDHFQLRLSNGKFLVYRDPRRFGVIDWIKSAQLPTYKRFAHLGPEPFSEEFNAEYLQRIFKKRQAPVKNVIMDQKVVVGVGNIYAAEALFFSGLRPQKPCHRIPHAKIELLVEEIRKVLSRSIAAGGTTISDFRQAGGSSGYFQQELSVYGLAGEPCGVCQTPIKNLQLGGRSSFYCPNCQRG